MSKTKKIMIVDDEPGIRENIEARVASWGYATFTAGNAEECFEKVKKEHPDAVLLDILMPGLNGIQACSRLRQEFKVPAVVMVSVLDDPATRHDAQIFGAFAYITKPVDFNILKKTIADALALQK